jgi:membrane-bound hydrogenase subunit beta
MTLMEQTNEIVEKLKRMLGDKIVEIKSPRKRRIFVRLKEDSFRDVVKRLKDDMKITHLSTITGTDTGQDIELLYHFSVDGLAVLSIGFKIARDNPTVKSLTDLVPGSILYEREIHEILGVNFEGHPNLLPLILPETWPKGVYPLRKDQKFEELRKIGSKS